MTVDITETVLLLRGIDYRIPDDRCVTLLGPLAEALNGRADWDEGDELWARILRDREVAAVLCMYRPVLFFVGENDAPVPDEFVINRVPAFDVDCLTASRDAMIESLGARGAGPELDPDLFSLGDFWVMST